MSCLAQKTKKFSDMGWRTRTKIIDFYDFQLYSRLYSFGANYGVRGTGRADTGPGFYIT